VPSEGQEAIEVYGALRPRPGELSATPMVEIEDNAQIEDLIG